MSGFLKLFVALHTVLSLNFLALFLAKVTDAITYKKLRMIDRAGKAILLGFLTVAAFHAVVAAVGALLGIWSSDIAMLSLFALVPIFTALPMIVLHFVEKKYTKPPKRIVISNVIYALLFDSAYCSFIFWWISGYLDDTFVIFGSVEDSVVAHWANALLVGPLVLIAVFVLLKIILQVLLIKRFAKEKAAPIEQASEEAKPVCDTPFE